MTSSLYTTTPLGSTRPPFGCPIPPAPDCPAPYAPSFLSPEPPAPNTLRFLAAFVKSDAIPAMNAGLPIVRFARCFLRISLFLWKCRSRCLFKV